MRIDVFCRVVDNFGDAGVTWRLARQLAAEHGAEVVLRIDVPQALARIADDGCVDGAGSVEVRRLRDDEAAEPLPSLVIEGFGCGLPSPYLAAMAASRRPPVWVNLEYLSAEPWVESVHGLPSPHPRLPLTRHFFFPGFTRGTGGLLRERDVLSLRAGAGSAAEPGSPIVAALRAAAERTRDDGASVTTVSLFCYANRALPGLLDAWVEGDTPVLCIVPEGVAAPSFDAWLAGAVPHAGQTFARGALMLATVPFVSQADYDRLLWSCDFDFVRGEDSFVRAQWGERPFVWHIYPQADDAHRVKLEAFLDRYLADAHNDLAAPVRAFWRAWNDADPARTAAAWPAFAAAATALASHNARWAERLAALPDLASSLVEFCRKRL